VAGVGEGSLGGVEGGIHEVAGAGVGGGGEDRGPAGVAVSEWCDQCRRNEETRGRGRKRMDDDQRTRRRCETSGWKRERVTAAVW
jgi:hypothetical protein